MAAPSHRSALGALFLFLAAAFAGIAVTALEADEWVIAIAGGTIALWLATLAVRALGLLGGRR
jgi:hypothetical protein